MLRHALPRITLLSTLLLALVACQPPGEKKDENQEQADGPRSTLVEARKPIRGKVRDRLEITGRIEAFESAEVMPRLAGTILEIKRFEGELVERDDILAVVECEQSKLALASRKLAVRSAQRAIEQSKLAQAEAQARSRANTVTLEREARNLERSRSQHAKGVITDQDLENAQHAHDTAIAEKERLAVTEEQMDEDLKAKEVMLEDAENAVQQAELECEFANIRATIAGRITKRHVKLGAQAMTTAAAFSIKDLDTLVVEPTIPEKELSAVRVGQAVEFETTAWPGKTFTGTIDYIANEVDVDEGAVGVRVRIPETDPPLLPGMFVSGRIVVEERADVLMVPKKALLFDRDRAYVYVLDRGDDDVTVRKIYLERGLQNAEAVEYLPFEGGEAEIDDSSEIVLVGLDRLYDGAPVEIYGEEKTRTAAANGEEPAGE